MDLAYTVNAYEDIPVPVGTAMTWGFELEPWNATGTSAVFRVNGTTNFAVVITVTSSGDDSTSQYLVTLTPTQLASLGLDVSGATATYSLLWTDSLGAVWSLGYGVILAQ